MQHMDEGLLQAWLDGPRAGLTDQERAAVRAHLDACPLCQERADALQAASERAVALLALAEGVDDEIPDFAAVLQRAEELNGEPSTSEPSPQASSPAIPRSGPEAAVRARPWFGRRTAWAASIMVALGAGWLANEWNTSMPDVRLDPLQVTESPASAVPTESAADLDRSAGLELGNRVEAAEEEPVAEDLTSALADASTVPGEPPSPTAGAGAEVGAVAAERGAAAEDPRAREAEVQASRLAPPPVEPDPVAQLDATPVPQRKTVSGRVVDAASGRPLEAAQVLVRGTNTGTLTNANGTFLLFPEPSQDSAAQLRIEIVGYRGAEFTVDLSDDEIAVGDVALDQTTVALDELVVTGSGDSEEGQRPVESFAATVPMELSDDRWSPASMVDAEAHLGASPGTVPGLPVVAAHIGTFDGRFVVRVEQELEDGGLLTLVQARTAVAPGDMELGATTELPSGVFVRGWADVSADSLRALVERVQAN